MLLLQPPEFTGENVKGFPVRETLTRFLGHLYDINCIVLDSVNYGLPVARARMYQVGRHRGKTSPPCKTLQVHCDALRRPCNFGWDQLFWLNDDSFRDRTVIANERLAEWTWAANRPSSKHMIRKSEDSTEGTGTEDITSTDQLDFQIALTEQETFNAEAYELRWPGMCFSLNQNVEEHSIKSTSRYLQTFIHNFGIIFTYSKKIQQPRWLFGSESLSGMGFPVVPGFVEELDKRRSKIGDRGFLLTSFHASRPTRKPTEVRAQCGNSDSLLIAAVAELYPLLYFEILGFDILHDSLTDHDKFSNFNE